MFPNHVKRELTKTTYSNNITCTSPASWLSVNTKNHIKQVRIIWTFIRCIHNTDFCTFMKIRHWESDNCLSNSQLFHPSSEGLKNFMKYLLNLVNTMCWIFESLGLGRMKMSWALLRTDHWKFRPSQLPQFCFHEYLSLKLPW